MKPGAVFGENIRTEKVRKRYYSGASKITSKGFLLPLLLMGAVILITGRLIYLEIIRGEYFRKLSDSNRIRTQIIYAPRGIIFDRNGVPLVFNVPGFRQVIKDTKSGAAGKTVLLTKEKALTQIAKGANNIAVDSMREYPYRDELAHVLGYIGQINEDQLKDARYARYSQNDLIGKTGIEEEYEKVLRGRDGKKLIEVDAQGRPVRSLGQTDPAAGGDIVLTIDAELQKSVFKAARNIKKGAVIVTNPTGEILAMVSKPSFDPNLFTKDTNYRVASDSAYKSISAVLFDSESQPLLNRAVSGTYPPGSTFKLVVVAAGLMQNIIDASYRVTDTGILHVGTFSFANWFYTQYSRREPGELDVIRAIARSNDIFFYKLAGLINVDRLSKTAKEFGVGKAAGIDLPGEAAGVLPSREWKKENIKEDWYLGDTYHYGIGQGFLLATPLQVNNWPQIIANGGIFSKPHLLKEKKADKPGEDESGNKQKLLNEKTIDLLRRGMIASCSPGGVAFPLFNFRIKNQELRIKADGKNYFIPSATNSAQKNDIEISIACKTGTAQHGGEKTLPHAWITLFAPAYDPEIVVTVLSESSGEGSKVAAPVAKEILEGYFGIKNQESRIKN